MKLLIEQKNDKLLFKDVKFINKDEAKKLLIETAKKSKRELKFIPNNDSFLAYGLNRTRMSIFRMRTENPEQFEYNMKVWNYICEDETKFLEPLIKDWIPEHMQKNISKIAFNYIDFMYNTMRRWSLKPKEEEFKEWLKKA